MASDLQKYNAKRFISLVIEIIGENMDIRMPKNKEIKDLLVQAGSKVEGDPRFSELLKQLASTVEKDEETFAVIAEKLDEYQGRIRDALENKLPYFDPDPKKFYKKP